MNSDDDIIDLILRGKNVDDLIENDDEDYYPETLSSNLEDKIMQEQNPTSIEETNNDETKITLKESLEETKNEKYEIDKVIKDENGEKIKEKQNKEIKKNKIEEQKKVFEKFPLFKNPLDFVKYLEIDRVSKDILIEMQNLILENHIKKDNKYEVLNINSLLQINNGIMKLDINLMFIKKNIIIFHPKIGNLLLFSIKDQKFIKTIVPKNIKNSNIICIDITNDLQEIICGYQDGTIAVLNLQTGDTKYTNNKTHKDCSCIELKIYKKDKDKNELYFISSGGDSQVFFNCHPQG